MRETSFWKRENKEWVRIKEKQPDSENYTVRCYKCKKMYSLAVPRGTLVGIDCRCGHKWNELIP